MTVAGLIDCLKTMPQDLMVVVNGYEGGVNELKDPIPVVHLVLNVNTAWYYGRHEESNEPTGVQGVLLG